MYVCMYVCMCVIFVPNELFLVIKKKAYKYKIIQTLSSSNYIYSFRYMIMAQKLKNFG